MSTYKQTVKITNENDVTFSVNVGKAKTTVTGGTSQDSTGGSWNWCKIAALILGILLVIGLVVIGLLTWATWLATRNDNPTTVIEKNKPTTQTPPVVVITTPTPEEPTVVIVTPPTPSPVRIITIPDSNNQAAREELSVAQPNWDKAGDESSVTKKRTRTTYVTRKPNFAALGPGDEEIVTTEVTEGEIVE